MLSSGSDGRARSATEEAAPSNVFGPIRDLNKAPKDIKSQLAEYESGKQDKFSDSLPGIIAKAPLFEQVTIGIIVCNAISIGYDADYSARWHKPDNLYYGPVQFIIFEVFFCVYFTLEILIRFLAYRQKSSCFRDGWFVFDSTLVTMMIVETAILPVVGTGGPLGQLTILRLLRLLRITRMAKLMRAFPQLLMIVRGINAAMRAVSWTALLLVLVTMMTAVMFTNQFHQGAKSDAEVEESGNTIEYFFGSMGKSMLSLLVMGTILDDVTACSDAIRATGNYGMVVCFLLYILLNSFTMMNMLVGILVEVVGTTADAEKKSVVEGAVRDAVMTVFVQMDSDGSGRISKDEFLMMKSHPKVMKALQELDIREKQFDYYVDLLFVPAVKDGEDTTLSFEELLDCILRLRPGSKISSLDFASFRQGIFVSQVAMRERIVRIESTISRLVGAAVPSIEDDVGTPSIAAIGPPDAPTVDVVSLPGDDQVTPTAAQCAQPVRITASMLADLEQTPSAELIAELQRRFGITGFEETGVPLYMMDEELQSQMKVAANLQVLGTSQQQEHEVPHQVFDTE